MLGPGLASKMLLKQNDHETPTHPLGGRGGEVGRVCVDCHFVALVVKQYDCMNILKTHVTLDLYLSIDMDA